MSLGEKLFLVLVFLAFGTFIVTVAFLSWNDAKYDKRADEPAAKPDTAELQVHLAA